MAAGTLPTIDILLNGEPRTVPSQLTVRGLLDHVGVTADRVAVELNRTIVRRPDWDNRRLEAGDQLEVVMFVGGG